MLLNVGFIKSQEDIDKILNQLDKIEIMGENPIKYRGNDKIYCKLEIINSEYIVRTAPIEFSNDENEQFKLHIGELTILGVIRKSISKHRSTAFIVMKHAEIVRGKSKMVINYKRLNDNTRIDGYNIQDKSQLIKFSQISSIQCTPMQTSKLLVFMSISSPFVCIPILICLANSSDFIK